MEIAQVLLSLAVIFILAKVASRAFAKLGVPGLIGEIILGILLVNIVIGDFDLAKFLDIKCIDPSGRVYQETHGIIEVFSELGVIFLLFTVGLETKVSDLTSVGKAAALVAIMGVIVPFIVGFAFITITDGDFYHSMFMGAAMVATSVGITARVIKDMKLMDVKESRIIIGAAVIFFAKTAICWQGAVIFALVVLIRWKWAKLNPIWSLAVSALLGWVLFLV